MKRWALPQIGAPKIVILPQIGAPNIVTLPQIGAPKIVTLLFEWTHKKRIHHGASYVEEAIVCSSLYFVFPTLVLLVIVALKLSC